MAPKVSYNYLGKSGLKVSNLCLGTLTFDNEFPKDCPEETAHGILDRFAELGGNFIDTADLYAGGKAETIVGRWLKKQDRKKFVISTKCFNFLDPADPNSGGLSRKHLMDAIAASLHRLQTDYIDLFQIHKWDNGTPIEETFGALNDLVREGKIRYLGVSNVTGWQLQKIIDVCKARGWLDIVALQQQWSLMCRFPEFAEYQVARLEGVGVLAWGPLKGGILSDGYVRGEALPSDSRVKTDGPGSESSPGVALLDDKYWALMQVLRDIAQQHGRSVSQVALRWLLQQDVLSSVIMGVKTLQQLNDNMEAATGWQLSQEQMDRLNKASAIEAPYPYCMIAEFNKTR